MMLSFPKLIIIALRRNLRPRILLVILFASILLVPAFAFDNTEISRNISNNYFLGNIQPKNDTIIENNTVCFILIGNSLDALNRTGVNLSISAEFIVLGEPVSDHLGSSVSIFYNTISNNGGGIFINSSHIDYLIYSKLKQYGNVSLNQIFIQNYQINSFRIPNGTNVQNDVFFSFHKTDYSGNSHISTMYFYTLPTSKLGYYGLSEIFYTLPSQRGKFNITVTDPDNPELTVLIVHDGTPGIVYSIENFQLLDSLNEKGFGNFRFGDSQVRIIVDSSVLSYKNKASPYANIGPALLISFSSLCIIVSFTYFQKREVLYRFLSLPVKRSQFIIATFISSVAFMLLASAISFLLSDLFWKLSFGIFLNPLDLIYVGATEIFAAFAITSIYVFLGSFHVSGKTGMLNAFFVALFPLLSILTSAYFFIISSGMLQSGETYLLAPHNSYATYYNFIRDIIPLESDIQLNKYLSSSPLLGIKMEYHTNLLGLDPLTIILSAILIPLLFISIGMIRYSGRTPE